MKSGLYHVQAVWALDKLCYLSELHLPPVSGGRVNCFKGPLIRLNKILGGTASASRQDRVTRFTFPSETNQETKRGQRYRNIIFKTLYIKQQNTVIPLRDRKKGNPALWLPQLASLKRSAVCGVTRGNPGETWKPLWVERLGRPRQLEHVDHRDQSAGFWRGKSCTEHPKGQQMALLEISAEYESVHAHEETTRNKGQNHPNGLKGTLSGVHTRPGIMPRIPTRTHISRGAGERTPGGLTSVAEHNEL